MARTRERALGILVACSLSSSLVALSSHPAQRVGARDQRGAHGARGASAAGEGGGQRSEASLRANVGDGLRNGLASGLASATCKTLLHPFDVIKTVEQASKSKIGMRSAIKQVVDESGSMALFTRGLDVTLIGSVPSIAVYFGAYQFFKKTLSRAMGPDWRHTAVALSAALANSIAAFFRVPAEIVKQRVQAGLHQNAVAAVCDIYREGGFRAFLELRSVVAQMMRDIPFAVVMLVVYEGLKAAVIAQDHVRHQPTAQREVTGASRGRFKRCTPKTGEHLQSAECDAGVKVRSGVTASSAMRGLQGLGVGAVAGGLGALLTTPLDVVKTRWMVDGKSYRGLTDVIVSTWSLEGPSAFFKGAIPRVCQKIPSSSVFFFLYEVFRALLGVRV